MKLTKDDSFIIDIDEGEKGIVHPIATTPAKILENQKLRELIEAQIKVYVRLSDSDYKGDDIKFMLEKLLEESKK